MFCKSCGRQIDNDSRFCSICGAKQSVDLNPQVKVTIDHSNSITQKVNNDPIFNNPSSIVQQRKYDLDYKKEDNAVTFGIFLLAIALIFAIVGPIKFEDSESYGQFRVVLAIVSLILRIIITVWVVNIAKRQNRDTFGWGLFAFLLPSIALIVIATRKKLFAKIEIVHELNNEQNSKILYDKAQEFYNEKKYSESVRFAEKAIELDNQNLKAIEFIEKGQKVYTEFMQNIEEEKKQDLLRKYSLNADQKQTSIPEFTEVKSIERSSLLNGKYLEIEILFIDGKRTIINFGVKSQKYFIEYGLNKITYFANINDCISYAYLKL